MMRQALSPSIWRWGFATFVLDQPSASLISKISFTHPKHSSQIAELVLVAAEATTMCRTASSLLPQKEQCTGRTSSICLSGWYATGISS